MIKGKINIKKVLSLLLLTCILVGLIGCGEKPAKQQPTAPETALSGFSVGYSMAEIANAAVEIIRHNGKESVIVKHFITEHTV